LGFSLEKNSQQKGKEKSMALTHFFLDFYKASMEVVLKDITA